MRWLPLLLLSLWCYPLGAAPRVQIVMTVDWEGDDLLPKNLQAMQKLRQEFPDVPLLHYLNAAYFTKPGANPAAIKTQIQSVLRPADQFGLHIHAWKTLAEAAGVKHRLRPTWERAGAPGSTKDCRRDCGFEIPISAYETEELQKLMRTSKKILGEQGWKPLKHFRAGGWVSSPSVMEALAAEGFITDSSAVPVPLVADEIVGMDLLGLLRSYWPQITTNSQPYAVKTAKGTVWEVPDNAGLADYMEGKEMIAIVQAALKSGQPTLIVAGFHQETADDWVDRVQEFLRAVKKLDVSFTIMPEKF